MSEKQDENENLRASNGSTAPWPDPMWRVMFWMLLDTTAASPFCHCGEEPYTRGAQCPTCQALTLKESIQRPQVKKRVAKPFGIENGE